MKDYDIEEKGYLYRRVQKLVEYVIDKDAQDPRKMHELKEQGQRTERVEELHKRWMRCRRILKGVEKLLAEQPKLLAEQPTCRPIAAVLDGPHHPE